MASVVSEHLPAKTQPCCVQATSYQCVSTVRRLPILKTTPELQQWEETTGPPTKITGLMGLPVPEPGHQLPTCKAALTMGPNKELKEKAALDSAGEGLGTSSLEATNSWGDPSIDGTSHWSWPDKINASSLSFLSPAPNTIWLVSLTLPAMSEVV